MRSYTKGVDFVTLVCWMSCHCCSSTNSYPCCSLMTSIASILHFCTSLDGCKGWKGATSKPPPHGIKVEQLIRQIRFRRVWRMTRKMAILRHVRLHHVSVIWFTSSSSHDSIEGQTLTSCCSFVVCVYCIEPKEKRHQQSSNVLMCRKLLLVICRTSLFDRSLAFLYIFKTHNWLWLRYHNDTVLRFRELAGGGHSGISILFCLHQQR